MKVKLTSFFSKYLLGIQHLDSVKLFLDSRFLVKNRISYLELTNSKLVGFSLLLITDDFSNWKERLVRIMLYNL